MNILSALSFFIGLTCYAFFVLFTLVYYYYFDEYILCFLHLLISAMIYKLTLYGE